MRTLVIGYGNLDRGDDGVAYAIVNELRRHCSASLWMRRKQGWRDWERRLIRSL